MEESKIVDNMEVGEVDHVSISTRNLRPRRLKFSKRLEGANRKMVCCSCQLRSNHKTSSLSTAKSDQGIISSMPCHAVFIFLDPLLLGILQVEYQSKPYSPFETHPVHMWTFLSAICIHSAVLAIKIYVQNQTSYYAQILSDVLLVAGALSSASLVFIFLPWLPEWFLIIMWASMLVMLMARRWLSVQLCWVFSGIMNSISQVKNKLNLLVECLNNPWLQHLPK